VRFRPADLERIAAGTTTPEDARAAGYRLSPRGQRTLSSRSNARANSSR
jgi:hypothetical protein